MKVITEYLELSTKGDGTLVNITDQIRERLDKTKMKEGNLTVFVIGSTAAITTFEYEPGLIKDIRDLYQRIAPAEGRCAHDDTWGDANGFSHLRAALQGPSVTVPFADSKLLLGTWQQVVLAEFDNRPRKRKVVLQFMGK
jgi:secondary thiamine-phosphate synthase enzyme